MLRCFVLLFVSHFFLGILCSFHSGWTEQSETAAFSFSKSSWLLWAISSFPWRWSKATYAEERGENAIRRQQKKREAQEEYCSYLLFFALTCPRLHDMMKIDGKSDCIVKTFFASNPDDTRQRNVLLGQFHGSYVKQQKREEGSKA